MKKSLSKVLARMAKDGDVGTVAEIIEEMLDPAGIGEETVPGAGSGLLPETGDECGPENAGENETVETDADESLAGVCERLDRIIALLQPAAADEEPAETPAGDLTEAVSEAIAEAVLENTDPAAEEITAVMEEILEPDFSTAMESDEDGEEEPLPEVLQTGDALRAALKAVRPALARMPEKQRRRVAGDIAAHLRGTAGRKAADRGVYAALASARRSGPSPSADLGRRIMAKRNPHYRQ